MINNIVTTIIIYEFVYRNNLSACQAFFLVGYVEESLWWPIQSPNIGGKKKASSRTLESNGDRE